MAVHFSAKPAGATQVYTWIPDLADGDSISSYTLTPTTITVISSEDQGDSIEMFLSGGSAGNVYPIAAEVETDDGESLRETLYLPVFGPGNAFSDTAEDVVNFALKPITGLNDAPETVELNDGLEWLNGMLASWRETGADVGIALPLVAASVMYCSDAHLLAIKNNLRVFLAEQYGRQVAPATLTMAVKGLQQIKWANLPNDRAQGDYF